MNFSQRKGLVSVRESLQTNEMSLELRVSLWNVLHRVIFSKPGFRLTQGGQRGAIVPFAAALWEEYFKAPIDAIPFATDKIIGAVKKRFFEAKWHEAYDFLEAVLRISPKGGLSVELNAVLEKELAGYRVIDGIFADVTSEVELEQIEIALQDDRFAGVSAHLKQALIHLANREAPDYRNSIKESISAVEGMAKIASGNPKATLGEALKSLENEGKLHGALRNGFSSLYGYTSDANGIRHSMEVGGKATAPEAKYFLVSCSAFVNYLKSRMS